MITTRVIPTGTASATTQGLLVEIVENTCKPYCVNSANQPSASVAFALGTVTEVNGVAVAPVTATITIVTPNSNSCGCAHTQVITESFDIAFTASTANNITLTPGDNSLVTPANVKCCKAQGVKLVTTLSATIA